MLKSATRWKVQSKLVTHRNNRKPFFERFNLFARHVIRVERDRLTMSSAPGSAPSASNGSPLLTSTCGLRGGGPGVPRFLAVPEPERQRRDSTHKDAPGKMYGRGRNVGSRPPPANHGCVQVFKDSWDDGIFQPLTEPECLKKADFNTPNVHHCCRRVYVNFELKGGNLGLWPDQPRTC